MLRTHRATSRIYKQNPQHPPPHTNHRDRIKTRFPNTAKGDELSNINQSVLILVRAQGAYNTHEIYAPQ